MNKIEQVDKIKRRLAIETTDNDSIIADIFDDALQAALEFCKLDSVEFTRKKQVILAIARESAAGLFNQRGNEGAISYTTGGQGAVYDVVFETMRKKLLQSGCRIWK